MGGGCGPLGPQNRFSFRGLSRQDPRPDHGEQDDDDDDDDDEKRLGVRKRCGREEEQVKRYEDDEMNLSGCSISFYLKTNACFTFSSLENFNWIQLQISSFEVPGSQFKAFCDSGWIFQSGSS
ncbi:hypothetical protein M5689_012448 [Euphorbia peplus]|nr:hypothetical protein M5689_012448 [Euphorbia peplus]